MSVYDFLIDFSMASFLILIGQLLRANVPLFQKFFIPASMIAGFIGLALGAQGLSVLPFSSAASSYAGVLIIMIFAVVGINGFTFEGDLGAKDEIQRIVGFQLYRILIFLIQFIIPIAVTLTIIKAVAPQINQGIGVLLAAGFSGGHGTAAAVGKTFADLGWAEATDLGMTFATIGLLTGIFGGLAFTQWATKKGHTSYVKDFKYISADLKTGLVAKENRTSIGNETISPVSLDTLCFHFSFVVSIAGAGYMLNQWVIAPHLIRGVPDFTVAYLIALIFFFIFGRSPVYKYIDTKITQNISGTCTDYLVFFGIASIKISIIVEYALPLTILVLSGFICVFLTVVPLGYFMNKHHWFERSLFCYGYSTGVFAVGFILLRIVDPKNKSKTIEDTAMTSFLSSFEIIFWSMIPAMLISGQGWLVVGGSAVAAIITIIIAITGKMWYVNVPLIERKETSYDVVND